MLSNHLKENYSMYYNPGILNHKNSSIENTSSENFNKNNQSNQQQNQDTMKQQTKKQILSTKDKLSKINQLHYMPSSVNTMILKNKLENLI